VFNPQGSPIFETLYSDWDSNPDNPFLANRIAQTIDNYITAATHRNPSYVENPDDYISPPFPNVRYIVLVGGDAVIPFYRVPDLTTFANEAEYNLYLEGLINEGSALSGALRHRTTLTDDIYGNDDPYNWPEHPFYVPDRAVGRLVEAPGDIIHYLEPYVEDEAQLVIDATGPQSKTVVTGYDFLEDQAIETSQFLIQMGLNNINTLTTDTWTADDLKQAWFDGLFPIFRTSPYSITSRVPIQSINAHFDHFTAIPAYADSNPDTGEVLYAQDLLEPFRGDGMLPFFHNQICYSVGCHGGLNVEHIENDVLGGIRPLLPDTEVKYLADFPQAFVKQGGNFVGNTGYGYGDTDLVAYGERLMLLFTTEIGRNVVSDTVYVGQPIGDALVQAKQRYLRNATTLEVYDTKTLMQSTLYGLPFLRVKVPNPTEILDEALPPDRTPPMVSELGTTTRIITFTNLTYQHETSWNGRSYPVLNTDQVVVEDSFVAPGNEIPLRFESGGQEGAPILPQFVYDLTLRGSQDMSKRLKIKGVILANGDDISVEGYEPQVTEAVTNKQAVLPPTFPAGLGVWYPDGIYNYSTTNEGGQQRSQLLVMPVQYKAQTEEGPLGGTQGELRLYEQLVFKVQYLDPSVSVPPDRQEEFQALLEDTTPPVIREVRLVHPTPDHPKVRLIAAVFDPQSPEGLPGDGMEAVCTYTYDTGTDKHDVKWWRLRFERVGQQGHMEIWSAIMPATIEQATDVRFMVTARDRAGNTTYHNGKGDAVVANALPSGIALQQTTIHGPPPETIRLNETYTFSSTLAPTDATQPVSYTWRVHTPNSEESMVISGMGKDTMSYQFTSAGPHTITLTVDNLVTIASVRSEPYVVNIVPVQGATITAPATGVISTTYPFTATLQPENATPPIQYEWAPEPLEGQGTPHARYLFTTTGVQTVTLKAWNIGLTSGVSTSHGIAIQGDAPEKSHVYLPLVVR
jgi:hypothetical protein